MLVTGLGLVVMLLFLMPLGYMLATALSRIRSSHLRTRRCGRHKRRRTVTRARPYPLYDVPTDQGVKRLALVKRFREDSDIVDPRTQAGHLQLEGPLAHLGPGIPVLAHAGQLPKAWDQVNFPLLFRNTFAIAIISTIGTLISCILVAYGFARFQIPGKNILLVILISTIVLPPQATIIPLYVLFAKIGWTGSWLPLLVPAFFANAYDVFLLRQYFMSIPKELDEAAMLDGANPLRTLISVIIPQAIPAITAVTLFHFFFTWNDYFGPLVYLVGKEDLYPSISLGIAKFVSTFASLRDPHQPRRADPPAPRALFFLAQRQFMNGIVVTGGWRNKRSLWPDRYRGGHVSSAGARPLSVWRR